MKETEKRKKILREEFRIVMDDKMEQEAMTMNGFGEGLAEMIYEKGEINGLLLGEEKKMIECIQKVMRKLKVSVYEAMDILDVPDNLKEKYADKVLGQ